MFPTKLPAVRPRASSRPGPTSAQSLLISWLRAGAAVEVAAAHLRASVYPGLATVADPPWWFQTLAFCTGYAHQAVVVFFVLSGWLVGGALLDRAGQPHALRHYALDRITRLWIVLLPTFLAMLALGLLDGTLSAAPDISSASAWSLPTFAGNLIGLQGMLVPLFGANAPLWSLSNESCYYLTFPLLLLLRRGRSRLAQFNAGLALIVVALLACTFQPAIMLYLSIWLLGAAASRLRLVAGVLARAALCGLLLAVSAAFRLGGHNNDLDADAYVQDLILTLLFLPVLASTPSSAVPRRHRAHGTAHLLAGCSFTLYVLHMPLLQLLPRLGLATPLSPQRAADLPLFGASLLAIIVLSYLFHLPFEANTHRLRRYLKRRLFAPENTTAAGAPWTPTAAKH